MSISPCCSCHLPEHAPDLVVLGDVARLDERGPDGVRERPDPPLDQALDRREADDRALVVEGLGDAPGDRVVVRDPEHERLAPVEQTHPRHPPFGRLRIMPESPAAGPDAACSPARGPRPAARPRRRPRAQGRAGPGRRRGAGGARPARVPVPRRDQHLARCRATALARWGAKAGFTTPPDRFQSALSASAGVVRREFGGRAGLRDRSDEARAEFAGLNVVSGEAADADPSAVAAVVLGDSPEELTKANLDRAFRLVRGGAELIGMHRNPWWLTPEGPTLDAGAFLVGPRVGDEAAGADRRQAVAGVLPGGGRPPGGRGGVTRRAQAPARRAGDGRRRRGHGHRRRRTGPACARSSSGPASTATRSSRPPRPVVAAASARRGRPVDPRGGRRAAMSLRDRLRRRLARAPRNEPPARWTCRSDRRSTRTTRSPGSGDRVEPAGTPRAGTARPDRGPRPDAGCRGPERGSQAGDRGPRQRRDAAAPAPPARRGP